MIRYLVGTIGTRALFVLMAFFVGGSAISGEAPKELQKVRIGLPAKAIDFSPYYIGARIGIYQKEGIEPEFVLVKSSLQLQALLSGGLDYSASVASGIIPGAVTGMPVRVLSALVVRNIFFLLGQPEITDVKQLKGKRIGVTALAGGSFEVVKDALKNPNGSTPSR